MFKAVNKLLFDKVSPNLKYEILSEFSPYMTIRYASFYSDNVDYVNMVNNSINTYSSSFKNIEDQYKFFDNVIYKLPKKKIEYIKKPKENIEEGEIIPEFSSIREQKIKRDYLTLLEM